jgi:hypothetical protein
MLGLYRIKGSFLLECGIALQGLAADAGTMLLQNMGSYLPYDSKRPRRLKPSAKLLQECCTLYCTILFKLNINLLHLQQNCIPVGVQMKQIHIKMSHTLTAVVITVPARRVIIHSQLNIPPTATNE